MLKLLSRIIPYIPYLSKPSIPPLHCHIPAEILLQIFTSIENGEYPGCAICRLNILYRCTLVCRVTNQATTKLLYTSLDLTFDTRIKAPADTGHPSEGPWVKPVEKAKHTVHCPLHYRLWRERDRRHSFREQERTLALLRRTLSTVPNIPQIVKEVQLPERYQYPWVLGNNIEKFHPSAANIAPHLITIFSLLPYLESVTGLNTLASFTALIPTPPLHPSLLSTISTTTTWKSWDWGSHQNPHQLHYLTHLIPNNQFTATHTNWHKLHTLTLGTVLLKEATAVPFHHLPSLRSLSLSGTNSLTSLFSSLPDNQLSSLYLLQGFYEDPTETPLVSYLHRTSPTVQRLTNLTVLTPDTSPIFISTLLYLAPKMKSLYLALSCTPERLVTPGLHLRRLRVVVEGHDWSWLVAALEGGMLPVVGEIGVVVQGVVGEGELERLNAGSGIDGELVRELVRVCKEGEVAVRFVKEGET